MDPSWMDVSIFNFALGIPQHRAVTQGAMASLLQSCLHATTPALRTSVHQSPTILNLQSTILRALRPSTQSPSQTRLFSRTPLSRLAARKPSSKKAPSAHQQPAAATASKKAATGTISSPPPPKTTRYQSFADSLALRPEPTLLYRAPPHGLYITGCYAFGGFCFIYAGYNFYTMYLRPPASLPKWVPMAFGAVCFTMACFGTYCVLGASRLIRTIHAIPIRASTTTTSTGAAKPTLTLQITTTPLLPYLHRPRPVLTPPSTLSLSAPLISTIPTPPPPPPTTTPQTHPQQHQQSQQNQQQQQQQPPPPQAQTPPRFLSHPLKSISYWSFRTLSGFRLVWTREGFVKVAVRGRNGTWKMDKEGWVSDGFERLMRTKTGL
ncbi:MAG: hypothetical protein M1819_004844 [Sarea resinae]|nr:MAG: hypothetical protein M1819_004844 [Sarea resinae]